MSRSLITPYVYEPTIKVVRVEERLGFRLKFNKQNDTHSPVVSFSKTDFLNQQIKLKTLLEEFQYEVECCRKKTINYYKDSGVIQSLRNLTEYGYETYDYFRNGVERISNRLLNLWISEFESSRSWQNNITEKYLNIVFPIGVSFPFGLYFLKNPESLNWEINKIDIKEIIGHFLDCKAYIINDFNTDEILRGKPINITNSPLKLNRKSSMHILHGIDEELTTDIEIQSWDYDKHIDTKDIVKTKSELTAKLSPKKFPRIVHFSSHFYEEDGIYKLSLSQDDVLTKGDILRFKKLDDNQLPALFFFNACNSGISIIGEEIGFIEELYPEYALGFITTIFEINDKVAGQFANKFYQNFFNGRKLIEAIYQAKRDLINNNALYSVIGYTIWQVDPELKYYGEDYIKNRTINQKKLKNGIG